jgi:F-type H+-transporting ATPase subunit b
MIELFNRLGIDISLLIAQIINFGLLLIILRKFVYAPIVARIEKDEHELRKAQELSKILEEKQRVFEVTKKKEVSEAKQRAQDIIEEAESIAENIKTNATHDIEQEKRAVMSQIRSRLKKLKENE